MFKKTLYGALSLVALVGGSLALPASAQEPAAPAQEVSQPSHPPEASGDAARAHVMAHTGQRIEDREPGRRLLTRQLLHTRLESIDPEKWLGRWGEVARRDVP